jgi:RNA polymerase-associated protein CTR9
MLVQNGQNGPLFSANSALSINLIDDIDEILAAIHHLENVVAHSDSDVNCLESLILLASLRAHPRPAMTLEDAVTDRAKARDLYDRVTKVFEGVSGGPRHLNNTRSSLPGRTLNSIQSLKDDVEMHLEIAALHYDENIEVATTSIQEAMRVNKLKTTSSGSVVPVFPPRLQCNLAVLRHLSAGPAEARSLYEEALLASMAADSSNSDSTSTTILYNLARAYEDLTELNLARDAYLKLLRQHPEYVDGSYLKID